MSTTMNKGTGPILPPSAPEPRDEKQLRSDRWTAAFVVAFMVALIALIIWLASTTGIEYSGPDYWQMMP